MNEQELLYAFPIGSVRIIFQDMKKVEVIQLLERTATVLARRNFDDLDDFFSLFGEPAGSKLWDSVAKRLGVDPAHDLPIAVGGDKGAQGIVLQLPGDKVLKLSTPASNNLMQNYGTMDSEAEIKAAAVIMEEPNDLVMRVFDVFKIKSKAMVGFGIVMEKLQPLEERFWIPINVLGSRLIGQPLSINRVKAADMTIRSQGLIEPAELAAYKEAVQWLLEVSMYLDDVGIKYLDLHRGNVMMRDGELVLVDFGLSKTGQLAPFETLEAEIKAMRSLRA